MDFVIEAILASVVARIKLCQVICLAMLAAKPELAEIPEVAEALETVKRTAKVAQEAIEERGIMKVSNSSGILVCKRPCQHKKKNGLCGLEVVNFNAGSCLEQAPPAAKTPAAQRQPASAQSKTSEQVSSPTKARRGA